MNDMNSGKTAGRPGGVEAGVALVKGVVKTAAWLKAKGKQK
jgi:hypothetical protein